MNTWCSVPATAGVIRRRNRASRVDRVNWNSDERTTRVASSAGPPSTRAATLTAINVPDVPMRREYPAPIRPTPYSLNNRGYSADCQRGKNGPGEVGFTPAAGPDDDGRRQYDTADNQRGILETETEGQPNRETFIWFVADILIVLGSV